MDRFLTTGRAVAFAGVVGLAAAILTAVISGVPVPQIHDEFSYLLAADTYAHGRLTNPAHALWPWFETFHVLSQPTYMSKYPPAQGAFLALGVLAGLPIAGVWLSSALACAAVAWMLAAWLPPRWALAGGVLLAVHPTMLFWTHSYWGASVAVIGGALTVGAARRLIDGCPLPVAGSQTATGNWQLAIVSLLLGIGVVLLANTRPWEGAVLVAALFVVAAAMRLLRWQRLIPAMIVVALGGAFMLYNDWRVTRDPLLMPYALYEQQYNFTPPLVWQTPHPVTLRMRTMRHITMAWAYDLYKERRTPIGFLASIPKTIVVYVNGAFQFVPDTLLVRLPQPRLAFALSIAAIVQELPLLAPLLLLPAVMRRDRTIRALVIVAAIVVAVALVPAVVPLPHYGGPITGMFVLFWLASVRECMARFGRTRAIVTAIAAVWLFGVVFFFVEHRPWRYRWDEVRQRLAIERRFSSQPGRHLLLVHYLDSHNPHFEWVQNGADIDAGKIVWAHDEADNAPLLRYFAGRDVWRVTVGDRAAALARLR